MPSSQLQAGLYGDEKEFLFHNPRHTQKNTFRNAHLPEVRDDGGTGGGGNRGRAERLQQVGQQTTAVAVFGADRAEDAEAWAAVAIEGIIVVVPRQSQLVVLVVGAHHADLVVPVCGRWVFVDAQCAIVQLWAVAVESSVEGRCHLKSKRSESCSNCIANVSP